MKRLEGKVAIVTGAGSIGPGWGNGKATAVLYARHGARVLLVDSNRGAAEETLGLIAGEGGVAAVCQADVTKSDQVGVMVASCLERFGRIDVLHNNVGITVVGGAAEIGEADWDRVLAVNLKSAYLTCHQVLPLMCGQGGGAIINISSLAGIRSVGVPFAAYAASKAGLIGLTVSIAAQYARDQVRCNAILPGFLDTPTVHAALAGHYAAGDVARMIRIRDAQVPMGHMGDAWDAAYAALFLASDESRFITGQALSVDGGQSVVAVLPAATNLEGQS
jgi:NAD(P)-dependent dehydrogenase (short-subunit alcohol dehydrogenase family)